MSKDRNIQPGIGGDSTTRRRLPVLSSRLVFLLTGSLALGLTIAVMLTRASDTAFHSTSAHIALETANAVILILATVLASVRARRAGGLVDAVLAVTFAVLAISSTTFALLPEIVGNKQIRFVSWLAFFAFATVALGFLLAAFIRQRGVTQPHNIVDRLMLVAIALMGTGAVAATALTTHADQSETTATFPSTGDIPLTQHWIAVVVSVLLIASCLVAAWGLSRRAEREDEPLYLWIGVGLVLFGIAAMSYLATSHLSSEYVYWGDVLRFIAFSIFLIGSYRQVESYQRHLTQEAIFAERRRLARELHDGLAQELAYITAQTRYLVGDNPERKRTSDHLIGAAERALAESRLAISALTRPVDEPVEDTITDVAYSVGDRMGVKVRLDLEPRIRMEAQKREALLRILSEAITNAKRHGAANVVKIHLQNGDAIRFTVSDDGKGFALSDERRPDSLGLISMQERVEALGGELRLNSGMGEGTSIDVRLPVGDEPLHLNGQAEIKAARANAKSKRT
jgi:signal transduction histidine kinase